MSSGAGRRIAGAILIAVVSTSLGLVAAQETVDFGRAPAAGLRFKVTAVRSIEQAGTCSVVGGDEQQIRVNQTTTGREVFVQTVTRVEAGRVVALEREYDESGSRIVVATRIDAQAEPESREIECPGPLAWKHLRAEFSGEGPVLKVKEEDAWQEADEGIRDRLPAWRLLRPEVPLPEDVRKVGESWKLDAKTLREMFSETVRATAEQEVGIGGSARFTLAELTDVDGVRCAVIPFAYDITLTSTGHPIVKILMKGKILYSLEHRIFCGLTGEGDMTVEGEQQRTGQTVRMKLAGKTRSEIKVVVQGEAEAGPETKPEPKAEGKPSRK